MAICSLSERRVHRDVMEPQDTESWISNPLQSERSWGMSPDGNGWDQGSVLSHVGGLTALAAKGV